MGVPFQEPVETKRQASDDAPLQAPPNQFLVPEEQQPTGEQRPDPAKKARPPSPPGELRARTEREWLNLPAHERLRLPKDEDMEVIDGQRSFCIGSYQGSSRVGKQVVVLTHLIVLVPQIHKE